MALSVAGGSWLSPKAHRLDCCWTPATRTRPPALGRPLRITRVEQRRPRRSGGNAWHKMRHRGCCWLTPPTCHGACNTRCPRRPPAGAIPGCRRRQPEARGAARQPPLRDRGSTCGRLSLTGNWNLEMWRACPQSFWSRATRQCLGFGACRTRCSRRALGTRRIQSPPQREMT